MPDSLPFVRRQVSAGTRTYIVETVDDQDALIAAAEDRDQFPFGLTLWESAIALAEELAHNPQRIAGRSVLELGAGLGLTGVVAADLGATVTQTDHDLAALEACFRTARLNGITGIIRETGDWHDWQINKRFDVILGADVAYDSDDHRALLDVLAICLRPEGVALLADPMRENQRSFIAAAQTHDWQVRSKTTAVADLKSDGRKMLEIAIIELTRRS